MKTELEKPSFALSMRGVNKTFPGVKALTSVDFEISKGEVVALIGENGAGKSTLMNILGGVHQPDSGEIKVNDKIVTIKSVSQADSLGIGFVHQELNILDNLDVGANVYLGREPRKLGIIQKNIIAEKTNPFLKVLGLDISPDTPVAKLSIGQQQLVEIAKALSKEAKIIIMDEPTSSLTLSETDKLLNVISDLRDKGISIIYISHRLGEVSACADRVVALRDGENAGVLAKDEITHNRMVSLMVGRELERTTNTNGSKIDQSKGFETKDIITSTYPNNKVSFKISSGEILGMAGLVGAGRSEVAQTIFGVDPNLGGSVYIDGKEIKRGSAKASINSGIYLAPEDRKRTGLITQFDVSMNVSLASLEKHSNGLGIINNESEKITANQQIEKLNIKTPSAETPVINLSGGNQQKVVLGKWLSMNPKLLIFDEPTRGIDVGAKAEIYKLMRQLADKGVAILMISSDMEEVIGISDRIAVMHEGKITGILGRNEFTEENIMHLAVGGSSES